MLVRRVVQSREAVKNGGVTYMTQEEQAASKRGKREVSNMDDYDDDKRAKWCCAVM